MCMDKTREKYFQPQKLGSGAHHDGLLLGFNDIFLRNITSTPPRPWPRFMGYFLEENSFNIGELACKKVLL